MVQYGGDEVAALIIDIGSSTLRAGYAGDDTPKAIIPTYYGYKSQPPDADVTMGGVSDGHAAPVPKIAKMFVGQDGPSIYREGMEVGNPMKEGLIEDFNPITPLIRHALEDVMRINPAEHPILVTEPAWNTPANRERMAEIIFEEFNAPAFYIANTSVLNAFAAGKGSALVIDIGHSEASVTPVIDGFVLRKGLVHSSLPTLVHQRAKHILTQPDQNRRGINLLPHQLIANKAPVDPGVDPRFNVREDRFQGITNSWRNWAENREVDEWIQSVASVLDQGWNEQAAAARAAKQYEFPTGYNNFFGAERFEVGELFFMHPQHLQTTNPNLPKSLPQLISASVTSCDPDIRQVLLSNVVLGGGGSLFAGLADRLNNELNRAFNHAKIHAPGNPAERRYGGWLGGSILASLGTFHQLWISKEEWQEHGRPIVGQRCK